jgi:ABC-type sulfate transport system substrate-binding protein
MPSFVKAVGFVFPVLLAACAVDKSPPSQPPTTVGALTDPSVTTDSSSYAPGATITVTYAGLPGNYHDWIAIAPAGSPNTSVLAFVFTNGQTSGTATFAAPTAGSYVARAFANDDYVLLAESAAFTVSTQMGATISTDHSSYSSGANVTITVSYAGLPGNPHDWIAIAPAGSPNTSVLAFVFANGQTSGTATFAAPAAGSYVARAFANDDYILLAESAVFTVNAGVPISTDHSSYSSGSTITVSYAGLPGNPHDWIAIAPAGSPNTSVLAFVFTNGQISGTATFAAPADGSYVARAFANDDYILLAESAAFTVSTPAGTTISTDHSSYNSGSTIMVSYTGLPGNPHDWIAIAPAGSPNTSVVAFVFANGQTSGTATFVAPAAGSYVARAFANDDYILLAESAAFTVTPATAPATISTDHASYASGATITVSYTGLPGNPHDWIAIAPAGSANTSVVAFVFANGQTSGTATFSAPANGLYVARAFANDDYILLAESAMFTVCSDAGATLCFVASLSGAEEVPAHTTTATGSGVFTFDPATLTINYQLQHTVVGATASHIHEAPAGTNGAVIVPFTLVGQGASGSAVLTQAQADDLLAGNLYANVHSPTFPGGEIRGQIMKPGRILFVANLNQANDVNPSGSAATGTGSVIFDPATNNIIYQLQHTVVNATAAHIHQAPAGVDGPVIVPFTLVGLGASGTATLSADQATALQTAGCYMNVHSAAFPVGEIRGQLLRPGS